MSQNRERNPRQPRVEDEAYLASIRGRPCLVCGSRVGCDAHHLMRSALRGMGYRNGDDAAVPLCRACHRALHDYGGEELFFALKGVDAYDWARRSFKAWQEKTENGK